jgi:hypothetical protein
VSPRNEAAANALDARYRTEAATVAAQQPQGPQLSVFNAGGAGSSAQGATGIANTTPTFNTAGLSQREIARLSVQLANNRESNDTSRANNTSSNAVASQGQQLSADTQRQGQVLSALSQRQRLALDAQNSGVNNSHTQVQTQGLIALEAAKTEYANALASGDTKRVARAEETLRARQGKYEKEKPEQFSVVPIPGGVDPATGLQRGAGAIVVNKSDGTTKIISPEEAKGQGGAPKYEAGKVYRDAQGNKAKWDGSKFVPE